MIRTEQTKLLAMALNSLGIGAILAGVIVPTVNGTVANLSHIAAWVALGASLIAYVQVWLEGL